MFVLTWGASVVLAGCLFAGVWPGDRGIALLRCWWKIRYATSLTELAIGILGVVSAIVIYIVNGMARFVVLFGGVIGILSNAAAERNGGWLPTYKTDVTEMREIEKDG